MKFKLALLYKCWSLRFFFSHHCIVENCQRREEQVVPTWYRKPEKGQTKIYYLGDCFNIFLVLFTLYINCLRSTLFYIYLYSDCLIYSPFLHIIYIKWLFSWFSIHIYLVFIFYIRDSIFSRISPVIFNSWICFTKAITGDMFYINNNLRLEVANTCQKEHFIKSYFINIKYTASEVQVPLVASIDLLTKIK